MIQNTNPIEVKNDPEEVIKEAFWLAYQAAANPKGMGIMSAHPGADKEDVWENVVNAGDYPGESNTGEAEYYGDYVFGKMLKLRLYDLSVMNANVFGFGGDNAVGIPDIEPRRDYQSWLLGYDDYRHLVEEADSNLS